MLASQLCAICGLCCNGVLFFGVKLQGTESAKALSSRGLKIKRTDSNVYCIQPCNAHLTGGCAIYEDRPLRCREFECKQLLAIQKGELTEQHARQNIARARALEERVSGLLLLAGEERTGKAFAQRYAAAFTPPLDPSPEAVLVRSQLQTAMQDLEAFLSLHFRTPPESGGESSNPPLL